MVYICLPKLLFLFGCTKDVYSYTYSYTRIITLGIPFVIIYTMLSSLIRADGNPKYAMIYLIVGTIINIILDPIFIFVFKMGVAGGAIATVSGQLVSFIISILYINRFRSIKLEFEDFKINKSILKVLGYGLSSFITQVTVAILFIYMNNVLTHFGDLSKFGSIVTRGAYGNVSKINSFYISSVLGIAIGSQPIIGFNFGAGNYERVRETLKRVVIINFIIGIIFNLLIMIMPEVIVMPFGSMNNKLYREFVVSLLRIFLGVCGLNALEMSTSILIQSLGNVKRATLLAFVRQILLFIPISFILANIVGVYGILYAGLISDLLCFFLAIYIFTSEYKKIGRMNKINQGNVESKLERSKTDNKIVITIAREYGSGGRYVGKLLEKELGIKCYDKELMTLVNKKYGFSEEFISNFDEKRDRLSSLNAIYNNDDKLFEAYSKVIKDLAKKESCIIIGRCGNYVLKNNKNVLRIFIHNSMDGKIKRAVKYFGINKKDAKKTIENVNKLRRSYYKYYTGNELDNINNYDLVFNSDKLSIEEIAREIKEAILNINKKTR